MSSTVQWHELKYGIRVVVTLGATGSKRSTVPCAETGDGERMLSIHVKNLMNCVLDKQRIYMHVYYMWHYIFVCIETMYGTSEYEYIIVYTCNGMFSINTYDIYIYNIMYVDIE